MTEASYPRVHNEGSFQEVRVAATTMNMQSTNDFMLALPGYMSLGPEGN